MDTYESNIPGAQEEPVLADISTEAVGESPVQAEPAAEILPEQPIQAIPVAKAAQVPPIQTGPVAEPAPVQAEPAAEAAPAEPVQAGEVPVQPVYPSEPAQAAEAAPQQPACEAPAPRPRSPYANSPYVHSPYVHQQAHRPQAAPAPKKQTSGSGKTGKAILCAVLACVLLVGCCTATAFAVNSSWNARYSDLQKQYDQKLADLESKFSSGANTVVISGTAPQGEGYTPAQVYAMSVDGVVIINAKVTYVQNGKSSTGMSTGTGFIISEDGYVVTNYHVVQGGTSITVGTNDGMEHPAELIGYDDVNDVALLKVRATGLRALPIGDSDKLIVGDQVAAIGNPLGELTSTLTVGYISAKERDVNTDGFTVNMLQTDAAINSGNSGGPLLNMRGEVIGITTAKYSGTSSSGATIEGVGFAIPINDVVDLLNDLMAYGVVNSGYLGVSVSDVDPEAAAYYGVPRGARVEEVVPGYSADRAGLQLKDIIIALGEHQIRTVSELTRTLRKFAPGDTTTVTVFRSGKELVLTITLDEKPSDTSTPTTPTTPAMPTAPQESNGIPSEDSEWDMWYEYLKPFFDAGKGQTYDEWFNQFKDYFGK